MQSKGVLGLENIPQSIHVDNTVDNTVAGGDLDYHTGPVIISTGEEAEATMVEIFSEGRDAEGDGLGLRIVKQLDEHRHRHQHQRADGGDMEDSQAP
jgi:hypothetical protein